MTLNNMRRTWGQHSFMWLQLVLKACEVEDEFLMKLMSSLVDQSAIW